MKKSKKLVIALFFIFQICPHTYAVGSPTDNNIIWQASANEIVQFIDQEKPNPGKNDHPVVLQAKEIYTILTSIKFHLQQEDNLATEKVVKPVFSIQQTELLSQYLTQGLKDAKPHQDIIFVMEKSIKRSTFLKPARYFIAGRVFYKGNKLNIIIGDYDRLRDEAFEAVNDPTNTGHIHYSFDYGKRSRPSSFNKPITSINGVELKQLKNSRRSDWLVIDVNVASKSIEQMSRIQRKKEMTDRRNKLLEIIGNGNTVHNDTKYSTEKKTHSVEERLIELKHLRNKDLITDEEYSLKRKQILDDL